MLLSPWDERFRGRRTTETVTVDLPELKGKVTFREGRDQLWLGQIADLEEFYVFQHAPQGPERKIRMPIALPDGTTLPGSRDLFNAVAAAEVLQVPETVDGKERRLSMLDLVGIARYLPERWLEIRRALIRLTTEPETPAGNPPSEPGTTPSSEPGSTC